MENHRGEPWHSKSIEEIYQLLETSEMGLSDAKASKRLQEMGRNELEKKAKRTFGQMLLAQLTDVMILILIGASVFSFVLKEWTEAIVILCIVVMNTIIGMVKEGKANASLETLKKMSAPYARVLREGEESSVPASELVVGDIVFLEDGSKVAADLRLVTTTNLKMQEASLTGESMSVDKDASVILDENCQLGDRSNMAYTSSIVTYGHGKGIVVATGMHTEVGHIAHLLDEAEEIETPLKKKLDIVGRGLTGVGILACLLVIVIGMIYKRPFIPQLLTAVALAISVIPEGLPATATVVMALGVQRMAKKNALICKLPAVETLGNATVICSDKTGTLTLNQMVVTQIAMGEDFEKEKAVDTYLANEYQPEKYKTLIQAGVLCNNATLDPDKQGEILGDPTEGALIELAQVFRIEYEALRVHYPRAFEEPFDSDRKRMSTLHFIENQWTVYTKGAVDEMLPLCTHLLTSQGIRVMTEEDRINIQHLCINMAKEALRVLGFAMRYLDKVPEEEEGSVECELTFVGVVGMIDPPRKEVIEAVRTCKEAGIRTIMITGDHRITALAIAKELGIWQEGNLVVSGEELVGMSDDKLDEVVRKTTVFARVSPVDKLRIIEALKRNGEVAAMTGDGVNDSPALKAADIGVAMGITGTDVAKEAADMILLDDRFTTISYAIKEGRRVYRNIQKVIQFLLAGNIAEMLILLTATLLNWEAPVLGVHVLWINLATATLPALALGVDPASKNIMKHKPVKTGTLFEKDLLERVISQGISAALLALAAYWIGRSWGGLIEGQTMAFCVLAFSQIFRSLNQRSNTEPIWVRAEGKNPWLIVSFCIAIGLMLCILFIPALQRAFSVDSLNFVQWSVVLGFAILSVVQMEIMKCFKRKKSFS